MKRKRTAPIKADDGPHMLPLLHQVRKAGKFSQEAFAGMFGLSQMVVSLVESGQVTLLKEKRAEIEAALGVKIRWPE